MKGSSTVNDAPRVVYGSKIAPTKSLSIYLIESIETVNAIIVFIFLSVLIRLFFFNTELIIIYIRMNSNILMKRYSSNAFMFKIISVMKFIMIKIISFNPPNKSLNPSTGPALTSEVDKIVNNVKMLNLSPNFLFIVFSSKCYLKGLLYRES